MAHHGVACLVAGPRLDLASDIFIGLDGRGRVDYSVGGGIVADSTPAGEYQESLDKAAAMMRALAASQKPQPAHA